MFIQLPVHDLAYFSEGSEYFNEYIAAVDWAQHYAFENRQAMLGLIVAALQRYLPPFEITREVVNCHYNYIAHEHHYGAKSVGHPQRGNSS